MRSMRPRRKPQPSTKSPDKAPEPAPAKLTARSVPEEEEFEEDEEEDAGPRTGMRDVIRREMLWFDGFLRRWLLRLMVFGTHATIALLACYFIVWSVARGRSYDSVDKIPVRLCGLVLGTAPKVDGRDNIFFTTRIQAAADLYKGNKVQYLIVSGNDVNDEPGAMKDALIAKGVPRDRIYCDYAGYRTLDSIVRAERIFGQTRFTIISQPFHNPRALYIARRKGLVDCVAFDAADASTGSTALMHVRELAARVWAILDVEFRKTVPKILGEKVEIGEKHPPVDARPRR